MTMHISSPEYWIEHFEASDDELRALHEKMLETMEPASIDELAGHIIRSRVEHALAARREEAEGDGVPYSPSEAYSEGDTLVFAALDGARGTVTAVRDGDNSMYADYRVIEVQFGDDRREFAAEITWDHVLGEQEAEIDVEVLVDRYASVIAPQLRERLSDDGEWINQADRWTLRALLPEVNTGHKNLAEAILMLSDEPQPADRLLEEIEVDASAPEPARAMALEIALDEDERFRNVGAIESPLWTLASQP